MSLERDILVYRAYLALRKWRVVLEEVSAIQCKFSSTGLGAGLDLNFEPHGIPQQITNLGLTNVVKFVSFI